MQKKNSVTPGLLLGPRKTRQRTITQARVMIQSRLDRSRFHLKASSDHLAESRRHVTARNRALQEVLDIVAEFPPGTFVMAAVSVANGTGPQ